MNIDLKNIYPHYGYDSEFRLLVSKSGNVTACYEITLPDLYTMSVHRYEEVYAGFATALSLLGANVLIQKTDWFFEKKFEPQDIYTEDYFTRKSNQHFKNRKFREHKCFIFISYMMFPLNKYQSSNSTIFSAFRAGLTNKKASQSTYQDFRGRVNSFTLALSSLNLLIRELSEKEVVGSPTELGISEKFLMLDINTIGLEDVKFDSDSITVGEKNVGVFCIKNMESFNSGIINTFNAHPRFSVDKIFPIGVFEPIGIKLNCDHILNQYIYIENKKDVVAELETDVDHKDFLGKYSAFNELSVQDTIEYLTKVREGYLPVSYSASLIFATDTNNREEFLYTSSLIKGVLGNMGFTPHHAKIDAPLYYWGMLPGNGHSIGKDNFFLTTNDVASALINYEGGTSYPVVPEGILFVSRTGKPYIHEMFETFFEDGTIDNRNFSLVGPSGSGKSFFTNYWVRNLHSQKSQVVIIDIGNSYKRTCENLGGVYINYDENTRIAMNPFILEEDLYKYDMATSTIKLDEEKLDAITSIILTIWLKGEPTNTQKNIIKESIQSYYNHVTVKKSNGIIIDLSFNTYYEYLKNVFIVTKEQEFNLIESGFDYKNLLLTLSVYYKGGVYDYLLNSKNNDINLLYEPLVVFELDKIKDNPQIFPIVSIILIDLFINKMRTHKGIRKYLFLEEAWSALNDPKMAGFVKYLYRTVRKFYGTVGTITQDIEDLFNNDVIRDVIIKNSGLKIFFDQSKYQQSASKLAEMIGLSDLQRDVVMTLNRDMKEGEKAKEAALCYGNQKVMVVKIEVSPEENLAFSTNENEVKVVNAYSKKLGSIENGIDKIVSDKRLKATGYPANKEEIMNTVRI